MSERMTHIGSIIDGTVEERQSETALPTPQDVYVVTEIVRVLVASFDGVEEVERPRVVAFTSAAVKSTTEKGGAK